MNRLLVVIIFIIACSVLGAQFSGGSGTDSDPYLIASAEDLNNVRDYLDCHFLQVADINLGVAPYNYGDGWVPIGTDSSPFTGSYDGNSHHIYDMYIYKALSSISLQGLFASTSDAHLNGIVLVNTYINAGTFGYNNYLAIGGLVANNMSSLISNCYASVTIIGGSSYGASIGGLIGYNSNSTVENCQSAGSVEQIRSSYNTGGLIGKSDNNSSIINCCSSAAVAGYHSIGGLVGHNGPASSIASCYATGPLTSSNGFCVGGLVGFNDTSTIFKCYALGNVSTDDWIAGGLIGEDTGSYITDSYSMGSVHGDSNIGGLIGNSYLTSIVRCYTISRVFWSSATNAGALVGRPVNTLAYNSYYNWQTCQCGSLLGESRNTNEMTYPYAANTYEGWDFISIWSMDTNYSVNQGYPYLNGMPVTGNNENILALEKLSLSNHPNPFSQGTTLSFSLSGNTRVELTIYNLKGQLIRKIINAYCSKGQNSFYWDRKNDQGIQVGQGIYLCRISGSGFFQTRKITLID